MGPFARDARGEGISPMLMAGLGEGTKTPALVSL